MALVASTVIGGAVNGGLTTALYGGSPSEIFISVLKGIGAAAGGAVYNMVQGDWRGAAISAGASLIGMVGIGGTGSLAVAGRAVMAAAVGGTVSKLNGGSFANGAITAAFASVMGDALRGGFNSEPEPGEAAPAGKEEAGGLARAFGEPEISTTGAPTNLSDEYLSNPTVQKAIVQANRLSELMDIEVAFTVTKDPTTGIIGVSDFVYGTKMGNPMGTTVRGLFSNTEYPLAANSVLAFHVHTDNDWMPSAKDLRWVLDHRPSIRAGYVITRETITRYNTAQRDEPAKYNFNFIPEGL